MKKLFVVILTLGLFTTGVSAQKKQVSAKKVFSMVDLSSSESTQEAKSKYQKNRQTLIAGTALTSSDMKAVQQTVRRVMRGKTDKQLIAWCDKQVGKFDKAQMELFVLGINAIAEDNDTGETYQSQSSSDVDWVTVGTIVGGGVGAIVGLVVGIADVVPGDEGAWVAAGTAAGAAGGAAAGAAIETLAEGEEGK